MCRIVVVEKGSLGSASSETASHTNCLLKPENRPLFTLGLVPGSCLPKLAPASSANTACAPVGEHTTTLEVERIPVHFSGYLWHSSNSQAHAHSGRTQVVSVPACAKLGSPCCQFDTSQLLLGKRATSLQDKGNPAYPGFPRVPLLWLS